MKTTMLSYALILLCSLMLPFTSQGEELNPALCKSKAKAAAELLKSQGEGAFAALKDPNGDFRFGDSKGYVWVHDLDGIMLMHPIKPTLDGKNVLDMKDPEGHYLFMAMNELVEDKNEGWVPYVWPKPGDKHSSPKVSYVVLVNHNEQDFVVGSGIYDVTADDIKKLFPQDAIYVYE